MAVKLNFLKLFRLKEQSTQFHIFQFKPTDKHCVVSIPDSTPKTKTLLKHDLTCRREVLSWTM